MRNYEQRAFIQDGVKEKPKLTRRTKGFIKEARMKLDGDKKFNRTAILEQIFMDLEQNYGDGPKLESQTAKMGIATTTTALEKIDEYIVTHLKTVKK